MAFDFEQWYSNNTKRDVVYSFNGEVTLDVINKTLDDIETILLDHGLKKKKIKKAYNAIVESIQNLYHHSIHTPGNNDGSKFGSFVIKEKDDSIEILTGNYLIFDVVEIIKDRIDQINALEREDLKALYKKILSNEEFSEKGGGGLGMVDIAKRTSSKLNYSFFEIDEKYSFFELKVII